MDYNGCVGEANLFIRQHFNPESAKLENVVLLLLLLFSFLFLFLVFCVPVFHPDHPQLLSSGL